MYAPYQSTNKTNKFHYHSLVCEQNFLPLHFLCMVILFYPTALGIHFCETSLIFNVMTRLGDEFCLCDVNICITAIDLI